jgi:mannan endo-1,4-beta-mannosidase
MKKLSPCLARAILALALVILVCGGAALAEAANSGFVTAQGGELFLNGKRFRFASTNAYFMVDAGSDKSPAHTDDTMALSKDLGFTVLRMWGFLDGTSAGASLQPRAGVYNETAFRAMDYVLHKADLAGIRLLVAFVTYWSDYGGMPQYVQWCAPGQSVDTFYTNASCKQLYKNYVSHVLNRVNTYNGRTYKNDPTILGWELANEPRSSDSTGSKVSQWTAEMAAYVKAIDRNHLVGLGEEGFDTSASGYSPVSAYNNQGWLFDGSQGTSFRANTSVADVDFASIHVYPDVWNLPAAAGSTWISDHIRIARQLGKPLIVGEFGYQGAPWSVYHPWMQTFEAEKGAGALVWEIICATVCGNYGGSLAARYPSTSPVPQGMAQFAAIANADQGGVAAQDSPDPPAPPAPPAPPPAATVTIGPTTASPTSVSTGQGVTVSTTVTMSAAVSGAAVDLEVYDSSNVKVGQGVYSGQTFAAGTARSFNWTWPGNATPGTYTVKVGVFNADWSTMYKWDNAAASIAVTTPAAFTVTSTTLSRTSVARGQALWITTNVKATAAASGIQLDMELFNSSGAKVAQFICARKFAAGQTQRCAWLYRVPSSLPPGTYTVKVGVFSANWGTMHAWVNQAGTLVVK